MAKGNEKDDELLDWEDGEDWKIVSFQGEGLEEEDTVDFTIGAKMREKMKDYIVWTKKRDIQLDILYDMDKESYESMESTVSDNPDWMHRMPSSELYEYSILAQDVILEEAFDRMPTKDYPPLDVKPSDPQTLIRQLRENCIYERTINEDQEIYSTFYTKKYGEYNIEEDISFILSPDEFSSVVDWMIVHHSRMIPLAELKTIAPQCYDTVEAMNDDLDIDELTKKKETVYVGMRGVAVEAAFDLIYGMQVIY